MEIKQVVDTRNFIVTKTVEETLNVKRLLINKARHQTAIKKANEEIAKIDALLAEAKSQGVDISG